MTYTDTQIEQIKREVDAIKVIGTRIKLERAGREALALCPFHEEKTASFKVYRKENTWLWHCFGCSASGNVIQFIERYDRIPFGAAIEKVLSISGWVLGKNQVENVFAPVLEKTQTAKTMSMADLQMGIAALQSHQDARKWLGTRFITLETAASFKLTLIEKLDSKHPWAGMGWIGIPTITDGVVTCYKYRSLVAKKSEDGKITGILRQSGMQTSLYNLEACTGFDDVFLTEGEVDVWTMAQAGLCAVGLPSSEYIPSPAERDKLIQANRIFLAGDADEPGQKAMRKLWSEFRERVYLISWPQGCKDANDALVKECGGDNAKFQELVERLKLDALEKPMPFMYDLKQTLKTSRKGPPLENPDRLRFPWANIDSWTPVVPGDVMTLFATESKTGKSSWLMNILLLNAIKYDKIVVNYSCEIMPPEYARRAVASLTNKDRDHLTDENYDEAVKKLGDAQFFNGYQPKANYKSVVELLEAAKKRLGAHIFVVDHLHFLTRGSDSNENARVSEAMRLLKDFAFDYGVIVIVVGQPRKMDRNSRGREATAQDAKSSEAFGSDASQVFILHRDRVADQKEGDPIFSPVTKVKLDYSRESETKVTSLWFEGKTCTFWPLEKYQGGL